MKSLPVSGERVEQIRRETEKDETLKDLKRMIIWGWPEHKSDCPLRVQDYWTCRTELSVVDNIVLKGNKCVMTSSVHTDLLGKIREGHLGEESVNAELVKLHWTRMNQDFGHTTTSRSKQEEEPLTAQPAPCRPTQFLFKDPPCSVWT